MVRAAVITFILFLAASAIIAGSAWFVYYGEYNERVIENGNALNQNVKAIVEDYKILPWLISVWYSDDDFTAEPSDEIKEKFRYTDFSSLTQEYVESLSPEEQTAVARLAYFEMVDDLRKELGYKALRIMYYGSDDMEDEGCLVICCQYGSDVGLQEDSAWFETFVDYDESEHPVMTRIHDSGEDDPNYEFFMPKGSDKTYMYIYTPIISDTGVIAIVASCREWGEDVRSILISAAKIIAIALVLLLIIFSVVYFMISRHITERTGLAIERERQHSEMEIASKIQLSCMPSDLSAFDSRRDMSVYALIRPAKEVGGDFYDCFFIDDDHLALCIADVSDKGVAAAMFMMMAKVLIKNELSRDRSPALALTNVNRQLSENNDAQMFVTVWLMVAELSTGKCREVNAGHEDPAMRLSGGEWELIRYPHDLACGILPDIAYHEREFDMRPGDTVFVCTDGIPDAENTDKERFGTDRLITSLSQAGDKPKDMIMRVLSDADAFAGEMDQFDDMTMLCFTYEGTDTIEVTADDEHLPMVIGFADSKARIAGADDKLCGDIRLCTEEVFGNIIDHAYDDTGTAAVSAFTQDGYFCVRFADSGRPFDPAEADAPDTDTELSARKVGGLGVYLVQQLASDVRYSREDDMNILTVMFEIKEK